MYKGGFKKGKRHGYGLFKTDGETLIGEFLEGKFVGLKERVEHSK